MRVAMLHNRYRTGQPSGENTVVAQSADLLRNSGHEIDLYARNSDDIAQFGRKGRTLLPFRSVWSFSSERDLTQLLQAQRPDVVHVHNTFPLFSASVLRAAYKLDLPVVATLHNFRLLCANGVLQRNGRPCESCVGKLPLAAVRHGCYRESRVQTLPLATSIGVHNTLHTWQRYVDLFVVPSEFVRDRYVAAGFDPERFEVKPHAVPHSGEVRSGAGDGVVFLGRLVEDKGFADLLQAWDSSLGKLLVVGDGPLRADAEERGRKDLSVQVLGQLPWADGMDVLRSARAVVVPARSYETFGLVVVEAFAYGVPVVASRIGALAELVDDGETGVLIPPGDPEELRKAIGLVTDPETSVAFGEQARQVYLKRFTPERDLVATERTYTDAIARHATRGRQRAGRRASRAGQV